MESVCTPSLLDVSYLYQFDDRALNHTLLWRLGLLDWILFLLKPQNCQEIL